VPDETPRTEALAEAMRQLYAVTPEEFMAERKRVVAEARAAGHDAAATDLGKLRKPSIAAWAVNLLVRESPRLVERLDDLGGRMRAAQGRLDTGTLTSLRPERDSLLEELVRAAVEVVGDTGRSVSPAAQQDIRATAIAALADEQAMAAVASGQLTRALSYSGFGEVDLSEAVVRTTSGAILTVVRGGGGATAAGRRPRASDGADHEATHGDGDGGAAAEGADPGDDFTDESPDEAPDETALEAALSTAEADLARAQAAVDAARERAEQTRERLGVVERQLAKAREADERALEGVTDAVRARKEAEATRHTAQQALDRLRSGG
jgi:hypothetical protein